MFIYNYLKELYRMKDVTQYITIETQFIEGKHNKL